MKSFLFLILLIFLVYQWHRFSDQGNLSREEIRAISSYTALDTIVNNPGVLEKAHLVHCRVTRAGGIRNGGYCVLRNNETSLFTLTKGLPPSQGQEIKCILIPRTVLIINRRRYIVAAMVVWKPGSIEQQSPKSEREEKSFSKS